MRLDWKAGLGTAVTILLLWWALHGVPFAEVWARMREGNLALLATAGLVAGSGLAIRALRWSVLLRPLAPRTSFRSRFGAVGVGFMANNVLPWRVGEFARAYALSRVEPVAASAAFGTLVVERALDGLTLLSFLLVTMAWPTFPAVQALGEGPLRAAVVGFSTLAALMVATLVVLLLFPKPFVRVTKAVARFLPDAVERPLVDSLEAFLDALEILRRPGLLVLAALWTVGFWLFNAFSFWLAFRAYDIHLDFVAATFTEAVVSFGVALPSAPGFIGTFHYAADLALNGVYGVPEVRALAFAFGFHIAGWIPVTGIGLWYAWRMGLGLGEVGRSEERVELSVEREHPRGRGGEVRAPRRTDRSGVPRERRTSTGGLSPVARSVVIDAPAKVNLVLRVLRRDPGSGFHELETVFQAIDLADDLSIERAGDEVVVEVEGADVGPVADNLVTRAVRAFAAEAGDVGGLRLRLRKRVPAGTGLGGGSSDAASTLMALNALFGEPLARSTLVRMASELGSDVPFFLAGSPTAVAVGRGDRVTPMAPLAPRPIVVAFPGIHVATADAYGLLASRREESGRTTRDAALGGLDSLDWPWVEAHQQNDFEEVVLREQPAILGAYNALLETGAALTLLAGSGSAVFAVYREDRLAERAREELDRLGWGSLLTRTLEKLPAPALGGPE